MTTFALHHLVPTARQLLDESDDPRAQLVARALLEHLFVDGDASGGWSVAAPLTPPSCPSCGRRFATALTTGRQPVHGPTASRCAGSGAPVDDEAIPPEEDWS